MKKFNKRLFGCLLLLSLSSFFLSGCATRDQTRALLDFDPAIYLSHKDLSCMTMDTQKEILTHNNIWEKHNAK